MTTPFLREQQLRAAETDRDIWAARAGEALAENADLRDEVARLREVVRLLRVQLPLMTFALGPNPQGPDPGWVQIPTPRVSVDDAAVAPTRSPGR